MNVHEYAKYGLYDEARPDPARLELLDFLTSEAVTLDEIAAAERDGRLASVFTDRLAGAPSLSLDEVAARSGQTPELLARVWRAAGFPDPDPKAPVFTESDAEAVTVFGLGVELFGEEAALQLVRVVGSSLSRIAEAEISTAMANVAGAFLPTAASPLDAMRTSAALLSLVPAAELAIGQLLRRHLVMANRRLEAMRLSATGSELREVVVGFADLTGSTTLSVKLSWEEFSGAMGDFEGLTSDLIISGGGHVVKWIGDEVMFVAPGVAEGSRIAFALIDAIAGHSVLSDLRVGLAAGPVVAREGDYFGPIVHLASRLVDLAKPGAVVVTQAVAAAAASNGLDTIDLGVQTVQGFSRSLPVFLLVNHRLGDDS